MGLEGGWAWHPWFAVGRGGTQLGLWEGVSSGTGGPRSQGQLEGGSTSLSLPAAAPTRAKPGDAAREGLGLKMLLPEFLSSVSGLLGARKATPGL